jgi:hypothetical protein
VREAAGDVFFGVGADDDVNRFLLLLQRTHHVAQMVGLVGQPGAEVLEVHLGLVQSGVGLPAPALSLGVQPRPVAGVPDRGRGDAREHYQRGRQQRRGRPPPGPLGGPLQGPRWAGRDRFAALEAAQVVGQRL